MIEDDSHNKPSLKDRYKKRKDSLEGSLVQVLFLAELKFPKILVPRLPEYIKCKH